MSEAAAEPLTPRMVQQYMREQKPEQIRLVVNEMFERIRVTMTRDAVLHALASNDGTRCKFKFYWTEIRGKSGLLGRVGEFS